MSIFLIRDSDNILFVFFLAFHWNFAFLFVNFAKEIMRLVNKSHEYCQEIWIDPMFSVAILRRTWRGDVEAGTASTCIMIIDVFSELQVFLKYLQNVR